MEQFYPAGKIKKESGFHNFFLGAILLHLVIFFILNMHRVVKLDVTKEAFLRFTMIKLPPSPEVASQPKEEIQPQKTEVKEDAPSSVQEIDSPKAFKEVEEIKPMAAVQVEERDLLREKLGSFMPENAPEPLEALGGDGGNEGSDLPSSFERPDEGLASGGSGSGWGSGTGKGSGIGGGEGGFGGKKSVQRYSYGQIPFKQLISGVPDWVEKSNKIIITTVRVWIDSDGNVTKAEIAKSSGYLELDQLAVDSIIKRTFKPSDNGQTRVALIEIDFTNIR